MGTEKGHMAEHGCAFSLNWRMHETVLWIQILVKEEGGGEGRGKGMLIVKIQLLSSIHQKCEKVLPAVHARER